MRAMTWGPGVEEVLAKCLFEAVWQRGREAESSVPVVVAIQYLREEGELYTPQPGKPRDRPVSDRLVAEGLPRPRGQPAPHPGPDHMGGPDQIKR
ncbi:hypothetical protein B7494_g7763 [Chlorociboria aeruginascens]|nr:hypothetical protein B7494_g7763 [Chlorociboria aeruginascens]